MSDARLTTLVASSPAPARSPSVAFNLGSATGKNSWRPPARVIAVDQLSHAVRTAGTTTQLDQTISYDPLGNIVTISGAADPSSPSTTSLSYLTTERDRICHIAYGSDSNTACNVTYDELGSIVSQKTATGTRQYTYYIDGSVRSITDDKAVRPSSATTLSARSRSSMSPAPPPRTPATIAATAA